MSDKIVDNYDNEFDEDSVEDDKKFGQQTAQSKPAQSTTQNLVLPSEEQSYDGSGFEEESIQDDYF